VKEGVKEVKDLLSGVEAWLAAMKPEMEQIKLSSNDHPQLLLSAVLKLLVWRQTPIFQILEPF
jgi:hypothetical protein